jgi:TPR repeat protein
VTSSKLLEPVLCKWLALWGGVPWWEHQKPPDPHREIYFNGSLMSDATRREAAAISKYSYSSAGQGGTPTATGEVQAASLEDRTHPIVSSTVIGWSTSTTNLHTWISLAEGGDPKAQMRLASLFYSGPLGMPKDPVQACKWAIVAATNGQSQANYLLREMELFLSQQQKAEGEAAAKEFLKSHEP